MRNCEKCTHNFNCYDKYEILSTEDCIKYKRKDKQIALI